MAADDQKTWDEKHRTGQGEELPAAFLEEVFNRSWPIQPGKALDLATGMGRNAFYLARRGFTVEALDISEIGLREARRRAEAEGLRISFKQADLENTELPDSTYELIVNFNFLERGLIPKIKKALKLGGHIIFETYLVDQRLLGHPKNPAYLLGHNEILELFRDFRVLYYREGRFVERGKEAYRAGLLAQKAR